MTAVETSQIVTFRLGDDLFAADIYSVERVLRYQDPTAIPNVPSWIEGVIEYQQRVVPVINLRLRFDLPASPVAPETRILIFVSHGEWIAAVVDAVLEVTSLDKTRLSPPPKYFRGLAGEYLRGIVRRNERLVLFLDVAKLLSSTDRLTLEKATAEVTTDPASPDA